MTSKPKLVIGSRGSDLALYQANYIKDLLTASGNCFAEIKIIKTSGDRITDLSFDKMEGKGFFTKELEESLLARDIDLAVHSLKDLMTSQPAGLKLGAVGHRADRRELLIIRPESKISEGLLPVKPGGIIGTSSARRQCQIAYYNPTLSIKDLRGNVPTRINKLREGHYDAILIATAGVTRLNIDLSDLEVVHLDEQQFLPAPAQGILGIQIRENDPEVESLVAPLGSEEATAEAKLERGLLAKFDLGCSLPLGVCSSRNQDEYILKSVLGERSGDDWIGLRRHEVQGTDIDSLIDQAFRYLSQDS